MATPKTPTAIDIANAMAANNLSPLKNVWNSAITELNVMSESSDDEAVRKTASDLMKAMQDSAKPGASHHLWGDYLTFYCRLLDIDIERVSNEKHRSLDEAWMAEKEIDALESLKESAMAWAKVYTARYPK